MKTIIVILLLSIFVVIPISMVPTSAQTESITLHETGYETVNSTEAVLYLVNSSDGQSFDLSVSSSVSIGIAYYHSSAPTLHELNLLVESNFNNSNVYFYRFFSAAKVTINYANSTSDYLAVFSNSADNPSSFSVSLDSSVPLLTETFTDASISPTTTTEPFSYKTTTEYTPITYSSPSNGSSIMILLLIIGIVFVIALVFSTTSSRKPRQIQNNPRQVRRESNYAAKSVPPHKTTSPVKNSAFCTNCGTAVLPTDLYCLECGTKLKNE